MQNTASGYEQSVLCFEPREDSLFVGPSKNFYGFDENGNYLITISISSENGIEDYFGDAIVKMEYSI